MQRKIYSIQCLHWEYVESGHLLSSEVPGLPAESNGTFGMIYDDVIEFVEEFPVQEERESMKPLYLQ